MELLFTELEFGFKNYIVPPENNGYPLSTIIALTSQEPTTFVATDFNYCKKRGVYSSVPPLLLD